MNIFQIYLAGAMQGHDFNTYNCWRKNIKCALENIECDYKVKAINPAEYYNFEDDSTYDSDFEVMNFDLNKLRQSDLVILNFTDPKSLGTMAELGIAYDRGIPVIGLNENGYELHSWHECMCSKIFDNRAEMLHYVRDYYLN